MEDRISKVTQKILIYSEREMEHEIRGFVCPGSENIKF